MNLQHWDTVLETAQCASFSKAAERLYISVPSLIAQITLLEQTVGFRIFTRSRRGIRLTPAGEKYCEGIRALRNAHNELLASCKQLDARERRRIKIASPASSTPPDMAGILSLFAQRCPDIPVEFVTTEYDRVIPDMASGGFDIAFYFDTAELARYPFTFVPLYSEENCLCTAKNHRLANQSSIEARDLIGETVNLLPAYRSTHIGAQLLALIRDGADITLNEDEFSSSLMLRVQMGQLVVSNPRRYAQPYEAKVSVIPIRDADDTYGLVYRNDAREVCAELIACARVYFGLSPDVGV